MVVDIPFLMITSITDRSKYGINTEWSRPRTLLQFRLSACYSCKSVLARDRVDNETHPGKVAPKDAPTENVA